MTSKSETSRVCFACECKQNKIGTKKHTHNGTEREAETQVFRSAHTKQLKFFSEPRCALLVFLSCVRSLFRRSGSLGRSALTRRPNKTSYRGKVSSNNNTFGREEGPHDEKRETRESPVDACAPPMTMTTAKSSVPGRFFRHRSKAISHRRQAKRTHLRTTGNLCYCGKVRRATRTARNASRIFISSFAIQLLFVEMINEGSANKNKKIARN